MADASTSSSSTAPATPRFDFYQTDTAVTISIFVKSVAEDSLQVDIGSQSLHVKAVSSDTGSEFILRIDPLFSQVDVTSSSYKVLPTKIDVILHKAQPGVRWVSLQAGSASVVSAATPTYAQSTAAPRQKSKWDSFNTDTETDAAAGSSADKPADGGEADINAFFQKLYADADEDTRRAMMKSYQESGGTTLSTDWSKVGKGRVETTPPDGMEAKKW
ncbi:Protein SGT1 [Pseudozyma hubeiensis]|nr:Protein SGT1 [Pseudozyma hubeiensis]